MSKRKKWIILSVAVALFVILGINFFPPIHIPTRITYPYDVTIWGIYASIDDYLSEEKEIHIPKRILGFRVTFIEDFAFEDLGTDAVILSVPEGVNAGRVYHQESQCYYTLFAQNEAKVEKYVGNEKKLIIPQEVWGYKVTSLWNLLGNTEIEEVIIPDTVKSIYAFNDCKNLKQVTLPSHLESIGDRAFMNSGIERIELPETVKEIGTAAFQYSDLKEITGLENVEYIGARAFRGTPFEESMEGDFVCIDDVLYLYRGSDTEVIIPSTVKEIRGAFYKEENYPYPIEVKKVFIPDSVTIISKESFSGQDGIEVYIPETVTTCEGNIFGPSSKRDGTIVTTEGSIAESYAIEKSVPYRIITKEEMQQDMEAAKKRQENKS